MLIQVDAYTNPIQILYKSKSMPIQVQVDANPCCLLGIAFTIPFQKLVVSLMFQYLIFRIFEYKLEHFSPHLFAFIEPNCGDFEPVCNPNTYNIKLPHLFAFIEPNCGDFEPVCNPSFRICLLILYLDHILN